MIPKDLEAITQADLQALIDDQVMEGKTIEYKRDLPGPKDHDRDSLCVHVSSFANASGGDLIYGVEAKDGVPIALTGMSIDNIDQEKLRLEHSILNGIEPRMGFNLRAVEVGDEKIVLMIRVRKSWHGPHRVSRTHKFYARNSAGHYALDVGELRSAFNLSEGIATRIRDFRMGRVADIISGTTPVPMPEGGKLVLHGIPISSFSGGPTIDVDGYMVNRGTSPVLPPIGHSGWSHRMNLDGIVTFSGPRLEESDSYAQLFRSGAMEAVISIVREWEGAPHISWIWIEGQLPGLLSHYIELLRHFSIDPPVFLLLSILGAKGAIPVVSGDVFRGRGEPLDRDELLFPEIVIEGFDDQVPNMLRPLFKLAWNAFDFVRPD